MKRPQLASSILKKESQNGSLSSILAAAHSLWTLEQIVTQYLPDPFKHHCQISTYENGKLVMLCDSASWSNKLRFHTRHLNTKLLQHSEFSGLKEITALTNLRALTLRKTLKRHLPKAKKISIENRDLLIETAQIEANHELSDALLRLAKHACSTKKTENQSRREGSKKRS